MMSRKSFRSCTRLAFFLVAIGCPLAASGQRAADLVQGVRLRVVSTDHMTQEGFFSRATGDSITIIANGVPLSLSLSETSSVSRFTVVNRSATALRYALIAGTLGALAGAGIGARSFKPCVSRDVFDCSRVPGTRRQASVFGSVIFGASSVFIGGLVGAVRGKERWEPVVFATP